MMITYITVAEVDSLLGATWADDSKKEKSVLMANVWLRGIQLTLPCDKATHEVIIPEDVKLAGAYAAQAAANGGLFQQKTESGSLLSKSVDTDGVSVSKTYTELAANSTSLLDSDLQLAIGLLKPYGYSSSQIRILRG